MNWLRLLDEVSGLFSEDPLDSAYVHMEQHALLRLLHQHPLPTASLCMTILSFLQSWLIAESPRQESFQEFVLKVSHSIVPGDFLFQGLIVHLRIIARVAVA